ncbi:pentapeptide repeat-containing protein [Nonomuraea sp. NPDC050547]|uniref:pentapeptide repeat-containing protein n=1 Tax=Nonomuraea sp. NPDC050547 TaxID=3364368 RepID=UPI00378B0524
MTIESSDRPASRWKRVGWATMGLVTAVVLFWPVTDWLAHHDVPVVPGVSARDQAEQLRQARDAARGRILQVGAGLLAAGALIYTARNFSLARNQNELNRQSLELSREQANKQAEASRRTLELTEQGQITDRYIKGIEQLGSDTLDIRLGGIYALERLARDSARDRPTIVKVLSAFAREHAHEPWPPPVPIKAASQGRTASKPTEQRQLRPDVTAALAMVGRREHRGLDPVDLAGADFSHADLRGVHLPGVVLIDANFSRANLALANLSGALLTDADLSGADLSGTILQRANLWRADLSEATFRVTNLAEADLTGAIFDPATLDAELDGARVDAGVPLTSSWYVDEKSGYVRPVIDFKE